MALENYVGRVGGLAVALGVGAVVATGWSCPAFAEETSGSAGPSASDTASKTTTTGDAKSKDRNADGQDANGSDGRGDAKNDGNEDAKGGGGEDAKDGGDAAQDNADDDAPGADADPDADTGEQAPPDARTDAPDEPAADFFDGSTESLTAQQDSGSAPVVRQRSSNRSARSIASVPETVRVSPEIKAPTAPAVEKLAAAVAEPPAPAKPEAPQPVLAAVVVEAAPVQVEAPPAAEPPAVLVAAVSEPIGSDSALSNNAPISPLAATTVVAALAAVRDELERDNSLQGANIASATATSEPDTTPNVLVIGVDGTNLARVLADPANASFVELIQGGTTGAASIAGHTTLSNPSWTAVLTGVWGETTGVINNIYNPAVYDQFPTVFNQLETLNPGIETTAIANWDVIAAIGASGNKPADNVLYVPQVGGDTNWLATDDVVGDATEAAIAAASPTVANFIFSYFVGVDENGHLYGGGSPEYAASIANVNRNLEEILAAVAAWEAATGEQWTIIMVTDHGHTAEQGFGHGFQSPDETSTFVIANNPDIFTPGGVNSKYQIVDVTPTVVSLFGGAPAEGAQGVSLTTLDENTVVPGDDAALIQALQQQIAENSPPSFFQGLTLAVRTIFASIPYFLMEYTEGLSGPLVFIRDALYVATNFVAQIVARLTGVTGASIYPLLPAPLPPLMRPDTETWTFTAVCANPTDHSLNGACSAIAV